MGRRDVQRWEPPQAAEASALWTLPWSGSLERLQRPAVGDAQPGPQMHLRFLMDDDLKV